MKKFLSLALALIMTLSLVTISAGATEYKDLTDKDEIQYEEAVAVLNRLGIITGYSEGDFRPQGELTRGAAAKIIVSLLIGAEAAEALPVTGNPYPDVPAGNTFAGVISYCKNMKIIDGYSDGTFRPTGTLTGYAFSKMLLSALGYDGKQEGGFTGPGWTTNVAALGHEANLFDRISFNGGETVNRETACQLALNTLKATMVEYTGGMDVVVGDTQINAPKTRTFKTSNQEWASHIDSRRAGYQWTAHGSQTTNVNDSHYTVEFGEEKFKDLRMDHDRNTHDDFGRPANVWSYKKVTIGTFAIEPDFVYTTQVAHNVATTTDAAKVRALELNGYDLTADTATVNGQTYTNLWLNGKWLSADSKSSDGTLITNEKDIKEGDSDNYLTKVADIADYTDNGTLVEVYVDDADADFIRDVVVIKTQLMEVRSQKSESVALKLYDDASDADGKIIYGYNQKPIDKAVNDVEINDDLYATLKDKKVGDIIAVVPVYVDSETKYDVADAYIPETVSGTLTRVDTYGNVTANVKNDGYLEENGRGVISATVGGTEYKVALWNKDLYDIDGTTIRVTRKDVTLYMDAYGNAMLAKDVGATSNFMVVSGYHSGLVNGRVVTFVDGYDINGNEISLNIGNHNYVEGSDALFPRGNLVHYKSNTSSNYAEWDLDYLGVFDVASLRGDEAAGTEPYSLKASNGRVMLNGWMTGKGTAAESYKGNDNKDNTAWTQWKESDVTKNIPTDDAGVKFIYVTIGDDGEVDSVEIKNGMQAATNEEIRGTGSKFVHARAQACVSLKESNTVVNDDSVVKAVVIKQDSSSANLNNLVYIHNYAGSAGRSTDNQGRIVYGYEVKFIGASDWDDTKTIYSYKNLSIGDFARARKATEAPTEVQGVTEDNFYTLNGYDERTGVALSVSTSSDARIEKIIDNNKTLLRVDDYYDQANAKIHGVWTSDKDLDLGDELANDIVSIAHAKIIDLTGNDVENATDLKDLWNDVTDAQKAEGLKRNIKISMLYNDKDSDDEFRDVYVLVIRNASGTYKPEAAPAKTYTATVTLDGVKAAEATDLADKATGTLTVTVPADKTVDYEGKTYAAGETITISYAIDGKDVTVALVSKDVEPAKEVTIAITGVAGQEVTFSNLNEEAGTVADAFQTVTIGEDGTASITLAEGRKVSVAAAAGYYALVSKAGTNYTPAFVVEEGKTIEVYAVDGTNSTIGLLTDMTGAQVISPIPSRAPAADPTAESGGELAMTDVSNDAATGPFYKYTDANGDIVLLYADLYFGTPVLKPLTGYKATAMTSLLAAIGAGTANVATIDKAEFDKGYEGDEPTPPTPSTIEKVEITMTPAEPAIGDTVSFTAGDGVTIAGDVDTTEAGQKEVKLTITAPEGKTFAEHVEVLKNKDSKSLTIATYSERVSETTVEVTVTVNVDEEKKDVTGNTDGLVGAAINSSTPSTSTVKIYTKTGTKADLTMVKNAITAAVPGIKNLEVKEYEGKTIASWDDPAAGHCTCSNVQYMTGKGNELFKVTIDGKDYWLQDGMKVFNLKGTGLLAADNFSATSADVTLTNGTFTAAVANKDEAYVTALQLDAPNVGSTSKVQYKSGPADYDWTDAADDDFIAAGTKIRVMGASDEVTKGMLALPIIEGEGNSTNVMTGTGKTVYSNEFTVADTDGDGEYTVALITDLYRVTVDGEAQTEGDFGDLFLSASDSTGTVEDADRATIKMPSKTAVYLAVQDDTAEYAADATGIAAGNVYTPAVADANDTKGREGYIDLVTGVKINDNTGAFEAFVTGADFTETQVGDGSDKYIPVGTKVIIKATAKNAILAYERGALSEALKPAQKTEGRYTITVTAADELTADTIAETYKLTAGTGATVAVDGGITATLTLKKDGTAQAAPDTIPTIVMTTVTGSDAELEASMVKNGSNEIPEGISLKFDDDGKLTYEFEAGATLAGGSFIARVTDKTSKLTIDIAVTVEEGK